MVLNVLDAVSAYKNSSGLMDIAGNTTAASQSASGQNFGSMVKSFMGDSINSLREGEKASAAAANGKADLASVVTAMDNAELVLTEITTIRDKVIAAYKDITSSAI